MTPFYGWGSTVLRYRATARRQFIFPTNAPEIPATHLSTSEGWKAELNLEPPIGFELGIPRLGTQGLDH